MNEPQETLHLLSELRGLVRKWLLRPFWIHLEHLQDIYRAWFNLSHLTLSSQSIKQTAPSGCLLKVKLQLKVPVKIRKHFVYLSVVKNKNASVNEKHVCYDNFQPILFIIIPSVCRGTESYVHIWMPTHLSSPWYQEDCLSLLALALVKDMPQTLSSQSPGWHVDRLDVQLCAKKRPFPYVFRYKHLKEAHRETGGKKLTF